MNGMIGRTVDAATRGLGFLRQYPFLVAAEIAVVTALLAAGCGSEHEELQTWMDQQRREVKPTVEPLSPPRSSPGSRRAG